MMIDNVLTNNPLRTADETDHIKYIWNYFRAKAGPLLFGQ